MVDAAVLTLLVVPAHELTIMASNCCCLCGERQKESLDETGEIIEFIGWSGAGCTGLQLRTQYWTIFINFKGKCFFEKLTKSHRVRGNY